ncbi:hypothetical protein Tco_0003202 [Tanacetum coccineum]
MYVRIQDAQDERAVLRARMTSLEREARYLRTKVVTAEQEVAYTRYAWSFAMYRIRELQHQRQESDNRLTRFGERDRALKRRAGPPSSSR